MADAHGQPDGVGGAGGAGGRSILAKIPRPSVSGECSQEEFNFFKCEWERYVRSSAGVATTEFIYQLFSCPDENHRTALHRSHE